MADLQEEKILFLIKKKGLKIGDAIKKLGISKQTFYNNIRKPTITSGFSLRLKEELGVDVNESLNSQQSVDDKDRIIEDLKRKLEESQNKVQSLTDIIIDIAGKKKEG